MSGGGGGRRKRHQEEEHENHERWLVTYADMLTVLMALFIVMFALSVVDKAKFEQFKAGLHGDLGAGASLLEGGQGLQEAGNAITVDVTAALSALEEQKRREAATAQEADDLEAARKKILQALVRKKMDKMVKFQIDERGLVVTVVTDDVLFQLGSADLQPRGRSVLDAIAPALQTLPNPVTVEGHTDNVPIRGRYASNWELSTERATSVLRYLLDRHHVPAKRLSAAGYADQRPLERNATPAGRTTNRRVEVIVRATTVRPAAASVRPAAPAGRPAPPTAPGSGTTPKAPGHTAPTTTSKEH